LRFTTHSLGIGAEDLHADRALVGGESQLGRRRFVLAADALGRQELRDHDVGAEAGTEAPERRFRNARHRCQVQRHFRVDGERKLFHPFKLRSDGSPSNISI
jgi:hypothetical protein